MTLTLPIEIGKKYVRRDGLIVVAEADPFNEDIVFAGCQALYRSTGSANKIHPLRPYDLVADYIEPVKVAGHPHADRMAEYAEDAKVSAEPWELWEGYSPYYGVWSPVMDHPTWEPDMQYRRKPKTINIVGVEVSHEHILAARAEIEALFASVEQSK